MKKALCLLLTFLLAASIFPQRVITLDLQPEIDAGGYILDEEKGCWTETYNTSFNYLSFNSGMFNFTHIPGQWGGTNVGGGMSYWDGFTICNSGDTTDYGVAGSSDGWVSNQWGCMAGGGLSDALTPEQGRPYLVAYWGYYYETQEVHSCEVSFDGELHRVKGVYICNHPWPYYGNLHGDGFASPFDHAGCYFKITAHGIANGQDTGTEVSMTLAQYDDQTATLIQSSQWQWMDLSALGLVEGIYFTMSTSDFDPTYGPNTAVYFCLDKMQIYEHTTSNLPARPSQLFAGNIKEDSVTLTWAKADYADSYKVFLNGEALSQTADTTFVFSVLKAYTQYTLSVVAINGEGESDTASVLVRTADLTPPSAPTELVAEAVDQYTILLNWHAATDNVGVTRYRIFVELQQEARPKTTSYTITGLDPDTQYEISVDAMDAAGNISPRTTVSARTMAPPTPPDKPQSFSVITIADDSIVVNWNATPRTQRYTLFIDGREALTVSDTTACTLYNLEPGTQYTISLVALNQYGASEPNTVDLITTGLASAPADIKQTRAFDLFGRSANSCFRKKGIYIINKHKYKR